MHGKLQANVKVISLTLSSRVYPELSKEIIFVTPVGLVKGVLNPEILKLIEEDPNVPVTFKEYVLIELHAPDAKLTKELHVNEVIIKELSKVTCKYDGNKVLVDGVKLTVRVVAVSRVLSVKTPEIDENEVATTVDKLFVYEPEEYFETLLAVFV